MTRDYSPVVTMSIHDLWAKSGHDWQRPIVLPTLPVVWPKRGGSVPPVVPDKQRRDRLAFAIRAAMGQRSAQDIADVMEPKRSKETIARWARGETVPSALDVGPLARALGVRSALLIDPPDLPTYPLADYLIEEAVASGAAEGRRRSREARGPDAPAQSPPRPARAG
jgi:transcriptional regulator with XRE-family HTH domain